MSGDALRGDTTWGWVCRLLADRENAAALPLLDTVLLDAGRAARWGHAAADGSVVWRSLAGPTSPRLMDAFAALSAPAEAVTPAAGAAVLHFHAGPPRVRDGGDKQLVPTAQPPNTGRCSAPSGCHPIRP